MSLDRLEEHRRLWRAKADLRACYEPWFTLLLEGLPEGARVLEVGSGPGFLAEAALRLRPDLRWISSDLIVTPWNRIVADAARLPLVTGSVDAVVGIDVLHHLPRPAEFFREVARVLGGTGELRVVEPWITPLGWLVYRFFHQEDCVLGIDPWAPFPDPDKDAFDGNAAVPWRLLRDSPPWEWRHRGLCPPRCRRLNTFAYLLSLGFRERTLLPRPLVRPLLALDRWTRWLSPVVGLRGFLTWSSAPPSAPDSGPTAHERTGDGAGGAEEAPDLARAERPRPGLPRRWSPLAAALALIAVVVALAVWWPRSSVGWRLERLFPEPEQDLDATSLYADEELRRFSFDSADDASAWVGADGAPLTPAGGAVRLVGRGATRRITGPLGEEADTVDVIEVEIEQERPSAVALFWPRADGRFVADRAMAQLPDSRGVARFPVASHPRWQGRLERVAIQPAFSPQSVRVRSVRYLTWRLSRTKAAEAPRDVRAVELRGDRRAAAVVLDHEPLRRRLRVPEGALLRFALGVPDGAPASARFVLTLAEVGGNGGDEERLLEHRLRSGAGGEAPGWSEHEVDLGPWGDRDVELSLRIEPDGTGAPSPIGFWGDLQLRTPVRGPAAPSVILISADTLRADHLSLNGYGRPTTPHLERWARERGVVFRNAVAPSPWTLPSHVSLLTGVSAHRHGVSRQGPIPSGIPVLAERFREAGYATLASTGGGLVAHRFGFGRGFDVFRTREKTAGSRPGGELARGVEELLAWVSARAGEPFFIFFHTYETHTPLEPREPYFSRLRGREGPLPDRPLNAEPVPPRADDGFRQRYRFAWTTPLPDRDHPSPAPPPPGLDLDDPQLALDLYDSAIANLDDALGRLFVRLEELGLADDTIVVFTSDHGESFGENGLFAHTHLQDSNLMIPLLVSPRPRGGTSSVEAQVRLIDVAPTLLEMAGLAAPATVEGRSLLSLMAGTTTSHPDRAWSYAARTNRGLGLRVANRWKLIVPNTVWPGARGDEELYDLEADPGESRNLATGSAAHPDLRALAARELETVPQGVAVVVGCDREPCFEALLTGLGAQRYGVTSPDLTCPCVEPVDGGTRLRPGPGDHFTIVYEDVVDGELGVVVTPDEPKASRLELQRRVGPGEASFALRPRPAGWEIVEGAEDAPPAGLHVSYRGSAAAALPQVAREMEERLRNLGYIQ